jgi:hypothetical protein
VEVCFVNISFEAQVLLGRVVVPSLLGWIGGFVLSRCERRSPGLDASPLRGVLASSLFGALLVGSGLIVSDLWHRGMITEPGSWRRWDAREPWMWMVWMIPGLILFLGILKGWVATPGRFATCCLPWVLVGAAGILYVALPTGKGYEDQLPDVIRSMAIGIAAVALNSLSLNAIARGPGGRWVLCVLLTQLACIAGVAFQAYASLGEFALAGMGAVLGLSLVSLMLPSGPTYDYGWPLAPAVLGMIVLAVASQSVSTFYFSEQPPIWLRMSILFLPSLAGGVDLCLRQKHWGWRVLAAFVLSASVLSVVVFRAMQNETGW